MHNKLVQPSASGPWGRAAALVAGGRWGARRLGRPERTWDRTGLAVVKGQAKQSGCSSAFGWSVR